MALTYICSLCGGSGIARDAWAEWDSDAQQWVVGAVYDYAFCHDCAMETTLEEAELLSDTAPQY